MISTPYNAPPGFEAACVPVPSTVSSPAAWVLFHRGDVVLARIGEGVALVDDPARHGLNVTDVHGLGTLDGMPAYCAVVSSVETLPEGLRAEGLRGVFALLSPQAQAMAAYGAQVRHWDRTTRFCGECGSPTVASEDVTRRAKRCVACAHEWYPRVSPCTITLVHDGDRALLTRQAAWPTGRYGLVAGFVEPGESLEDCVRREAHEETGVTLADIAYAGSQPWPFPHQLMVGFTARWAGGEAKPRDGELEDARWFTRDAMPTLPPRFSIARRLIDAWLSVTST